jgi:signal transduction histidine kinase
MIFLKKNRYVIYTVLYFLFASSVLAYVYFDRNARIENELQSNLNSFAREKETIYENFRIVSQNIYQSVQNDYSAIALLHGLNDENKDASRTLLYDKLKNHYQRMQLLGVEQFHFHLPPNAESFLRFHQPDRYGDMLKNVRYSLRKVMDEQIAVEGFEMGRIIHGYRFVYPLFFNDEFIASVEVSMSTDFFKKILHRSFKKNIGTLLHSKYIDTNLWKEFNYHYKTSAANPQYYVGVADDSKTVKLPKLQNYLQKGEAFAILDKNRFKTYSFLPIKEIQTQEVVGYVFNISDSQAIASIYRDHLIISAILTFLFVAIYWFLRRDLQYKRGLRKTILFKTKELKEKERALMQQSRLAQMGELLNMIAHQWRQTLAAISSTANSLILKTTLDKYDKDFFTLRLENIANYSQHLSATVDDFRNFFKSHKEKREITLEEVCEDSLSIIEASIESKNIQIKRIYNANKKLSTYPSELRQVVLNLLKNAEDVLVERKVQNPRITISTANYDKNRFELVIKDNAGGISKKILDKIYDPYFTTKDEKNGSGLGLYMSKIIIQEHCNGTLKVSNDAEGAVFTVSLRG